MTHEPGKVVLTRNAIVSPAELLMIFINQYANPEIIPGGAVVGGATDDQQQAGCVSIMDAGNTKDEMYAPLLWKRCQIRCMGSSLDVVDNIGNHIFDLIDDQQNLEIEDQRGKKWFVLGIYCATGTSHHFDSSETFESLLFANITVARDPIPR